MKIILAGGTGFIGRSLIANSDPTLDWVVLSRDKKALIKGARVLHWDGKNIGNWAAELEGADALINLSGKSVNCRYNKKNMAAIFASRLDSTAALQKAMEGCKKPPSVWLNAASATIYRHSEDRAMNEENGEKGAGFSVEVCKAWEKVFFEKEIPGVRKIGLRTAIVLGKKAGVLPYFKNLVRWGMGGKMGKGNQMFSWIHESDFASVIAFLIANKNSSGVFNISAPNPLTNKDFMQLIRNKLKRKFGLNTPRWLLEFGAVFIGTETELVLKSRFVVPEKLLQAGFRFDYPEMKLALDDLLNK